MKRYDKIKSKFIKEQIRKSKWKDREYIEDLLFLEEAVLYPNRKWGYGGSMHLYGLKQSYRKEYHAIFKELDPKGFKKYVASEKEEREKEKKIKREGKIAEKELLAEEKRDWLKAGGKL